MISNLYSIINWIIFSCLLFLPWICNTYEIKSLERLCSIHRPSGRSFSHVLCTKAIDTEGIDNTLNEVLNDLENNVLKSRFRLNGFRPGQKEVITKLLKGQSCLAIFPTGYGKSLLYMLPAVIFSGITVIVSPLLALMRDQVDNLVSLDISAGRIDSSMSLTDIQDTISRLRNKNIKILYVSPERFKNEAFRRLIADLQVSLFVVDEAHCISEWGHAFRPDYLRLSEFAKLTNSPLRLALTATATSRVTNDIIENLDIPRDSIVKLPTVRSNLIMKVKLFECDSFESLYEEKSRYLINILDDLKKQGDNGILGPTIIYVNRQKTAEKLEEVLKEHNYTAQAYHARMTSDKRESVENWFLNHTTQLEATNYLFDSSDMDSVISSPIVIGTTAFGMGVDRKNIRQVIHFDFPRSIEDYIQGCGRAGRDGDKAYCITFYSKLDAVYLRNSIYGATMSYNQIRNFVKFHLLALESRLSREDLSTIYLSLYDISQSLDTNEQALRLALSHLVKESIVTETTSIFRYFRVSQISSKAFDEYKLNHISMNSQSTKSIDIASDIDVISSSSTFGFDPMTLPTAIVNKIKELFQSYSTRKKWVDIDIFEIADSNRVIPSAVIASINSLIEFNVFQLNEKLPSDGIYSRYKLTSGIWYNGDSNDNVYFPVISTEDPSNYPSILTDEKISNMLHKHAIENQRRTLLRISEMELLLSEAILSENPSTSIWSKISEYFDNDVDSRIFVDTDTSYPETSLQGIDKWDLLTEQIRLGVLPNDDVFLLARFAAGLVSPRIFRLKLHKHVLFGEFGALPWEDIMNRCQGLLNAVIGLDRT